MTLNARVRASAMVSIALLVGCIAFIGGGHIAEAATSTNSVACFVFTSLNDFGMPLQYTVASDCPTKPATGGMLTVVKMVSNTGGGTATPSDFSVHVLSNGADVSGSPQSGTPGGVTYSGITPGTYRVSETGGPANYQQIFSGNCDSSGQVIVATGAHALCAVIDTYVPPNAQTTGTLNIVKLISGGAATSSNASIHVFNASSTDVAGSPRVGSSSGTLYILPPGVYTVSELSGIAGYTGTFSGNCSASGTVTVIAGTIATCTVTDTTTSSGSIATSTSDLSLSNTASESTAHMGDYVTYTLTAHNAGPATATGVLVFDSLPVGLTYVSNDAQNSGTSYASSTGVWSVGSLANGSTTSLHIATLVQNGTIGSVLISAAAGTNVNGDPTPGNNIAAATLVVAGTPTGSGTASGSILSASTSTVATGSCSAFLTGYIIPGAHNDPVQVARLQLVLKQYEGANITINGVYDSATIAATKVFQKKYGSAVLAPWGISQPTGNVYLTTRRQINEDFCHFSRSFPLNASELTMIASVRMGTQAAHSTSGSHRGTTGPTGAIAAPATSTITGMFNSASSVVASSTSVVRNWFDGVVNFFRGLFAPHPASGQGGTVHLEVVPNDQR